MTFRLFFAIILSMEQRTQSLPDVFHYYDTPPENNESFAYHYDELTGLLNLRGMNRALNYLERNMPGDFAVIAVDLDDLKPTNDKHGHAAGDNLLQRTGSVLRDTLRTKQQHKDEEHRLHSQDIPDAIASRVGGDEFVMLLPGIDNLGTAQVVQDRLQRRLQASGINASIGAAQHEKGTESKDLLAIADSRMYEEKNKKHEEHYNSLSSHKKLAARLGHALSKYAGVKPPR